MAIFAALAYEDDSSYINKKLYNKEVIKGKIDKDGNSTGIYKDDPYTGERYYFMDYALTSEVEHDCKIVEYIHKFSGIDTRFSATIYQDGENIVIVYRGTYTEKSEQAYNILSMATNYHIEEAVATRYTIKIAEKYPGYNIYITRHSLGGYLAEIGASAILTNPTPKLLPVYTKCYSLMVLDLDLIKHYFYHS